MTETFPTFAPLYTQSDEVGKLMVVIGRGTQRGSDRLVNGSLAGWNWGAGDGVQRWGTNLVSAIASQSPDNDSIYGLFDHNGLTEEATLSIGDSGGALSSPGAALGNSRGFTSPWTVPFIPAPRERRLRCRALRRASRPIRSCYRQRAGPGGILSDPHLLETRVDLQRHRLVRRPRRRGLTNLLEYGLHAQPLASDVAALPRVALEGNDLTLTYAKVTTALDIQYLVEQSSDLTNWSAAAPTNEIVATNANVQTIKANAARLFLRCASRLRNLRSGASFKLARLKRAS